MTTFSKDISLADDSEPSSSMQSPNSYTYQPVSVTRHTARKQLVQEPFSYQPYYGQYPSAFGAPFGTTMPFIPSSAAWSGQFNESGSWGYNTWTSSHHPPANAQAELRAACPVHGAAASLAAPSTVSYSPLLHILAMSSTDFYLYSCSLTGVKYVFPAIRLEMCRHVEDEMFRFLLANFPDHSEHRRALILKVTSSGLSAPLSMNTQGSRLIMVGVGPALTTEGF